MVNKYCSAETYVGEEENLVLLVCDGYFHTDDVMHFDVANNLFWRKKIEYTDTNT